MTKAPASSRRVTPTQAVATKTATTSTARAATSPKLPSTVPPTKFVVSHARKAETPAPGESRILPPFAKLKQVFTFSPGAAGLNAMISYEGLLQMFRKVLRAVPFDETWYLATYPDVKEAVRRGQYDTARTHFVENGYFEGRLATPVAVDEAWYMKTYPDVGRAIRDHLVTSAQHHFVSMGYFEGRMPGPKWS
jgi:hypothetical protein